MDLSVPSEALPFNRSKKVDSAIVGAQDDEKRGCPNSLLMSFNSLWKWIWIHLAILSCWFKASLEDIKVFCPSHGLF